MSEYPRTHRVAVCAYVFFDNRFLLLKRARPPLIWAPPGGRLGPDENPADGVRREVREECGLEIDIIAPVDVWHGDFGRGAYLSIDYLARSVGGQVRLSEEHTDYRWASMEDLNEGRPSLGTAPPAFTLDDFRKAWALYRILCA